MEVKEFVVCNWNKYNWAEDVEITKEPIMLAAKKENHPFISLLEAYQDKKLQPLLDYVEKQPNDWYTYRVMSWIASLYFCDNKHEEALKWSQQAAEKGDEEGMYLAGYLLQKSNQNMDIATEYFKKACLAGHVAAMSIYAGILNEPLAPLKFSKEAAEFYEKAAHEGCRLAMFALGLMWYKGLRGESRTDKAIYWLKKAVDKGTSQAATYLAYIYYKKGKFYNPEKARNWCLVAIARKDPDPHAMYLFASMLYEGKGGPVDKEEAYYWWYRCVELGMTVGNYFETCAKEIEETRTREKIKDKAREDRNKLLDSLPGDETIDA